MRGPSPAVLVALLILPTPGLAALEIVHMTRCDELGIPRQPLIHGWCALEYRYYNYDDKAIVSTYTTEWLEKRRGTGTLVPALRLAMNKHKSGNSVLVDRYKLTPKLDGSGIVCDTGASYGVYFGIPGRLSYFEEINKYCPYYSSDVDLHWRGVLDGVDLWDDVDIDASVFYGFNFGPPVALDDRTVLVPFYDRKNGKIVIKRVITRPRVLVEDLVGVPVKFPEDAPSGRVKCASRVLTDPYLAAYDVFGAGGRTYLLVVWVTERAAENARYYDVKYRIYDITDPYHPGLVREGTLATVKGTGMYVMVRGPYVLVRYWNPVERDGKVVSSELYDVMRGRLVSDEPIEALAPLLAPGIPRFDKGSEDSVKFLVAWGSRGARVWLIDAVEGKVVDEYEFRDPYGRRLEVFAPFVLVEGGEDGKLEEVGLLVVRPEFKVEKVEVGLDRLKVMLGVEGFASRGSLAAVTAELRDASGSTVAVSEYVKLGREGDRWTVTLELVPRTRIEPGEYKLVLRYSAPLVASVPERYLHRTCEPRMWISVDRQYELEVRLTKAVGGGQGSEQGGQGGGQQADQNQGQPGQGGHEGKGQPGRHQGKQSSEGGQQGQGDQGGVRKFPVLVPPVIPPRRWVRT